MKIRIFAASLLIGGCTPVVNSPQLPAVARVPLLTLPVPSANEGVVVLDPTERRRVDLYLERKVVNGVVEQPLATICETTPCAVTLPLGANLLMYSDLKTGKSEPDWVSVSGNPQLARHVAPTHRGSSLLSAAGFATAGVGSGMMLLSARDDVPTVSYLITGTLLTAMGAIVGVKAYPRTTYATTVQGAIEPGQASVAVGPVPE